MSEDKPKNRPIEKNFVGGDSSKVQDVAIANFSGGDSTKVQKACNENFVGGDKSKVRPSDRKPPED